MIIINKNLCHSPWGEQLQGWQMTPDMNMDRRAPRSGYTHNLQFGAQHRQGHWTWRELKSWIMYSTGEETKIYKSIKRTACRGWSWSIMYPECTPISFTLNRIKSPAAFIWSSHNRKMPQKHITCLPSLLLYPLRSPDTLSWISSDKMDSY